MSNPTAYRPRRVASLIVEELERHWLVIVGGMRGSGKSTLMRRELGRGRRFLSLADVRHRAVVSRDPDRFLATLEGSWCIDQVERAPGLLDAAVRWAAARPVPAPASLLLGLTLSGSLAPRLPSGHGQPHQVVQAMRRKWRPIATDQNSSASGRETGASLGHSWLAWDDSGCPWISAANTAYIHLWSLATAELAGPPTPSRRAASAGRHRTTPGPIEEFGKVLLRGGLPGPEWAWPERSRPERHGPKQHERERHEREQHRREWDNGGGLESLDEWMRRHWDALLRRDLVPFLRSGSAGAFERFLLQVAQDCGRSVNYSRWAQGAGVVTNTARAWWRLLMMSGLAFVTPAYPGAGASRAAQAPRAYLSDTGLLANLLGCRDSRDATTGSHAEALLLAHVAGELLRLASDAGEPALLAHWRPRQGVGVDFIFESESVVYSVVCSALAEPEPAKIKAVKQFQSLLPSSDRGPALAICLRDQTGELDGVQLLPAAWLQQMST
jgi:hypothetical protein